MLLTRSVFSWSVPFWQRVALVLCAGVLADIAFRINPTNYYGGGTDDQRYLEAALAWMTQGPHAGQTHWALRHPLVLAIVAAFRSFGISTESMLMVPRLFGDALVMLTTAMLARTAGPRAALLWLGLILLSPIVHEMATSCFPEMLELTFGAVSLWSFHAAATRRPFYLVSGLALAAAILTRETAIFLLPLYGYSLYRRGHLLVGGLWFALGAAPPVLADTLFLWRQTGDLLYRLHIDSHHVGISSAHLKGGVFEGRPFLNPSLAARWVPSGPVRLHWAVDPIINLFADPAFGGIFVAWAVLAWTQRLRRTPNPSYRRMGPTLFVIAIGAWLVVTWGFTLRPQPRYYLFAVYAATIAVALLASPMLVRPNARRLPVAILGLLGLCGSAAIAVQIDRQRDARLILPWLRAHPEAVAHLAPEVAWQLGFPAALAHRTGQISTQPAALGALRIRALGPKAPLDPVHWQTLEILEAPRHPPLIGARRRLVIERRLR